MKHLDLFSGIGGFALAASWVWGDEHEIVSFCDNDKAAQVVLSKHWPEVPIHDDIKTLDATKWRGTIDLVTGGFPCQPFSCAGKRGGASDDRYLWPEMLRVIAECRPRWVLGENVPGIIGMELDRVLAGLEGLGYETGALIVPACACDLPTVERHVWIVSAACGVGFKRKRKGSFQGIAGVAREFQRSHKGEDYRWDLPETRVCRKGERVPYRVDRLRLLGNSIVPAVAAEIFRAMKVVDESSIE